VGKIIMELLKTINPEKVNENNIPGWGRRKAARAVVFDKENRVGLLHVKNRNYYKLPGGGVEEGEDIKIALDRECEEELGIEIDVLGEVGIIVEFRSWEKLVQTSYCFLAKTNSENGIPNFTDEEKSSGFEIVWAEPKEALKLLGRNETTDQEGKFIEERDFCFLSKAVEKGV
jgi:8-oxo-dGTP pyrophosphatase MutT (NUDIX family)